MDLNDVKIDGETEYFCKRATLNCVIVASYCFDGASLVACSMEDDTFNELWQTEACFLSVIDKEA